MSFYPIVTKNIFYDVELSSSITMRVKDDGTAYLYDESNDSTVQLNSEEFKALKEFLKEEGGSNETGTD